MAFDESCKSDSRRDSGKMIVLFLTLRDIYLASSRYRVYQYLDKLRSKGIQCEVKPLPKKGVISRIIFIINSVCSAINKDTVFIQKILFPSPVVYILKILNKNIIFDFDDALYTEHSSEMSTIRSAKRQRRLMTILRLSKLIIVGNKHLEKYAKAFNRNVVIIPSSIDTDFYKTKKKYNSSPLIIGWIGTSMNLFYLKKLDDVFEAIYQKYKDKVVFKVVCDKPFLPEKDIKVINKKWTLEDEISEIETFDIGVMPLNNDEFSKGKCAFKALQYMACGVPCIVSPIGANTEVVKEGLNGYYADSSEEWIKKLSVLIENKNLREKFGKNGRKIVEKEYSVKKILPKIIDSLVIVYSKKIRISLKDLS